MTDYFVSAEGDDSDDGLTLTTPWLTVAKVNAASFNPGDTVSFRRGDTWAEGLVVPSSGTAASPIVFGAYGAGSVDPVIGTGANAVTGNGIDGIVIQDLYVANWTARGIWNQDGNDWTIQRCTVTGGDGTNPDHGIRCNATAANLTGIVIRDNLIGTISTSNNDSIFRAGILLQGATGAVVAGNDIETTYCLGIWTVGAAANNDGTVIEYNHITNSYGGGIVCHNTDNGVVRYNTVHDLDGMGVGVGAPTTGTCTNTLVHHNLLYNLGKSTNLWNGVDINNAAEGGGVYHNTIVGVFRHGVIVDGDRAPSPDWTIQNNIIDMTTGTGTGVTDGRIIALGIRDAVASTGFTEDNNYVASHVDWPYYGSYGVNEGTLYTLTDWRTTTSHGTSSATGAIRFLSATGFLLTGAPPVAGTAATIVGINDTEPDPSIGARSLTARLGVLSRLYRNTDSGVLTVAPVGTSSPTGLRSTENWEPVSDVFRHRDNRDTVMQALQDTWAANSDMTQTAVQSKLHRRLAASGYTRSDGARLAS